MDLLLGCYRDRNIYTDFSFENEQGNSIYPYDDLMEDSLVVVLSRDNLGVPVDVSSEVAAQPGSRRGWYLYHTNAYYQCMYYRKFEFIAPGAPLSVPAKDVEENRYAWESPAASRGANVHHVFHKK